MKVVLFANTEWYLYNFRRSLASALRDAGHEVLLLSPPGPYGEKLRSLGFRWLPAPMERRSLNPLRELALVNWLRGLIREEQVDLVREAEHVGRDLYRPDGRVVVGKDAEELLARERQHVRAPEGSIH